MGGARRTGETVVPAAGCRVRSPTAACPSRARGRGASPWSPPATQRVSACAGSAGAWHSRRRRGEGETRELVPADFEGAGARSTRTDLPRARCDKVWLRFAATANISLVGADHGRVTPRHLTAIRTATRRRRAVAECCGMRKSSRGRSAPVTGTSHGAPFAPLVPLEQRLLHPVGLGSDRVEEDGRRGLAVEVADLGEIAGASSGLGQAPGPFRLAVGRRTWAGRPWPPRRPQARSVLGSGRLPRRRSVGRATRKSVIRS